jgi:hypothetical protein
MLTWQAIGGFSVDASVRWRVTTTQEWSGSCATSRVRPRTRTAHALGDSSALASEGARLLYRLPEPDLQGRTALVLSPPELLARLSQQIPPPRVHRHRYHGVPAPHARLRAPVVAIGRSAPKAEASEPAEDSPQAAPAGDSSEPPRPRHTETPPERTRSTRTLWALLLARI